MRNLIFVKKYVKKGLYSKAIEKIKIAVEMDPEEEEFHYTLGMAYLYSGKRWEALEEYKILKELNQGTADSFLKQMRVMTK